MLSNEQLHARPMLVSSSSSFKRSHLLKYSYRGSNSSNSPSWPSAGGCSVCRGAGPGPPVTHLRACWGGVDSGAKSDNAGPHGPAVVAAAAPGSSTQDSVHQRVGSPASTDTYFFYSEVDAGNGLFF